MTNPLTVDAWDMFPGKAQVRRKDPISKIRPFFRQKRGRLLPAMGNRGGAIGFDQLFRESQIRIDQRRYLESRMPQNRGKVDDWGMASHQRIMVCCGLVSIIHSLK